MVATPIQNDFLHLQRKFQAYSNWHDYIKMPGHKCCFCKTNIHILKSLVHVKFSYDKRIHLCSYSISLTHRNLNNRVYNLCHEVVEKSLNGEIRGTIAPHDFTL